MSDDVEIDAVRYIPYRYSRKSISYQWLPATNELVIETSVQLLGDGREVT